MRTLLLLILLVASTSAFFLKKGRFRGGHRGYRGGYNVGYGLDGSAEYLNSRPYGKGYSKGSIFGGYKKRRPCKCGNRKPYYVVSRPQFGYGGHYDSDEVLGHHVGHTQGLISTSYNKPGIISTSYNKPGIISTSYNKPGIIGSGYTQGIVSTGYPSSSGYGTVPVYRPLYSGSYSKHPLHGKYREKPHGFKISTNFGSTGYRPNLNYNYGGYRGRTPVVSSYSNYRSPALLDSDEIFRTNTLRTGLRTTYGSPPLKLGSDEDDVGIRPGYGGPTGQIQLTNIRSSDES